MPRRISPERLYNIIYTSMEKYGYMELLMRANPQAVFNPKIYRVYRVSLESVLQNLKFPETCKEALQDAYARIKLRKMGVGEKGGSDLTIEKLTRMIESRRWENNETLYMRLGLLEGKGLKRFDKFDRHGTQPKVPCYSLLLATLGRIYYSVIHSPDHSMIEEKKERKKGIKRTAYLAFVSPSEIDLEMALYVRGLVGRFEAEIEEYEGIEGSRKKIFIERFGEIPDVAKPLVLSLSLDQNILALALKEPQLTSLSLSWVVLEEELKDQGRRRGRNFRKSVMLPLKEGMSISVKLKENQKPVNDLIQSIIGYMPQRENLPKESIEWLSRIAYAFINRDPEELTKVNLEVLRAKDEKGGESLRPLSQRELLEVCRIIENM